MKRFLFFLSITVQFSTVLFSQNISFLASGANSPYNRVMTTAAGASAQNGGNPSGATAAQMQMLGLDPSIVGQYLKSNQKDNSNTATTTQADQAMAMQQMLDAMFQVKTQQDALDAKIAAMNESKQDSAKLAASREIFGHEFFSDSKLSVFLKSSDSKAPDSYVLDVGDEISIAVWGYSDYNNKFKVNDDGYIQIPEFGRIYVRGLTFGAVKAQIGKRLASFINLSNTKYEISLIYSRSIDVNIVGEVVNPGTYKIPAINSVYNAINAANGITVIGSVRDIQVRRDGKIIKTVDVYDFLFNPMLIESFYLQNGDYIYVNTIHKLVEIKGSVRRPFKYELLDKENLGELLNFAGGFAPNAFTDGIQVTRFNGDNTKLLDVKFSDLQSGNFELKDGDVVNVPSISGGIENGVSVSGSVRFPGQYELKANYRISDLIKQSGGIKMDAYLDRGYVRRKLDDGTDVLQKFSLENILMDENSADNLLLQKNDIVQIFSKEDFIERFKVEIDGSVIKPIKVDYAEGLTLNDLLFYAGGLKTEAANSKIEISRVVNIDSSSEKKFKPQRIVVKYFTIGPSLEMDEASKAFHLMPMDKVYVRKEYGFQEQLTVTIKGEVKYPGIYPILDKNEKVLDVIERAGGLTPYAYIPNSHLTRLDNNQMKNIFELKNAFQDSASRANLILKDQDLIEIPTVNQMVSIRGAVRYPGLDSLATISGKYIAGKSARWYVKHYAGGFKKQAKKKYTLAIYPNGKVEYTHSFIGIKNYPTIDNEGATITVESKEIKPKLPPVPKEPVSMNIIIPSIIAGITSIASTLTLLFVLIKP